jgi:hypothetical protein
MVKATLERAYVGARARICDLALIWRVLSPLVSEFRSVRVVRRSAVCMCPRDVGQLFDICDEMCVRNHVRACSGRGAACTHVSRLALVSARVTLRAYALRHSRRVSGSGHTTVDGASRGLRCSLAFASFGGCRFLVSAQVSLCYRCVGWVTTVDRIERTADS